MSSVKQIMERPSVFAKELLDITPFPYQTPFLDDMHKRICFKTGRQVGKTMCTAIKSLHYAITRAESTVLLLSPTKRQSSLLFRYVKLYLSKINRSDKFEIPVVRETADTLELGNGSCIYIVPVGDTGDSVRGYTADIVIADEAAFMPEDVFTAVQPTMAATDGTLILISTPFGRRGNFFEAFHNKDFSTHEVESKESLLITQSFLDSESKRMTSMEYQQEYEGEFVAEADRLFPDELIAACVDKELNFVASPQLLDRPSSALRLAVDPARFGEDETAYVVLDVYSRPYRIVWVETENGKATTHTAARIRDLQSKWHFSMIYIDETALGGGIVDQLVGHVPMTPVNFSGKKGALISNIKILMEQGLLKYPDDKVLRTQFQGIIYEYSQFGSKLLVDHDAHFKDDMICALSLACLGLAAGESFYGLSSGSFKNG